MIVRRRRVCHVRCYWFGCNGGSGRCHGTIGWMMDGRVVTLLFVGGRVGPTNNDPGLFLRGECGKSWSAVKRKDVLSVMLFSLSTYIAVRSLLYNPRTYFRIVHNSERPIHVSMDGYHLPLLQLRPKSFDVLSVCLQSSCAILILA